MAKRGRMPRRGNDGNGAASLINALKFVSVAQKKNGQAPHHSHCVFYNGFITAFDGALTVGCPVEEDITACPNTLKLLDALLKCGEKLSITQLDSGKLSVKSDKFKALVPCERLENMPYVAPDASCAIIDDRIKEGIELVMPLTSESADRIALTTVLLQANTVVATNAHVLMEYWHGIDLPPNLLIPKPSAKAIVNVGKKLASFGFSSNSATFFYEDGSYIKTQLVSETFPNYSTVLNVEVNCMPLPEGFYNAVDHLQSFSENGLLYFDSERMRSHLHDTEGATYEISGLREGSIYNAEYLQLVRKAFLNVDFKTDRALFFGNNARGAIMGCKAK
jgi:hypothetical protein